jgi:hypothetical protein
MCGGIIEELGELPSYDNPCVCHNYKTWIKCSDRLPDKEGHYLIHLVNGFTKEYDVAYFFNNSYNNNWGGWSDENITHWMPLPEPPEESK